MTQNNARSWCFTLYDYEDWFNQIKDGKEKPGIKYLVCQKEICPETKRDHLQGYVEFTKTVRRNQAKHILGSNSVHINPRIAKPEEARAYCMKDKTRKNKDEKPFELGNFKESGQGKRNDIKKYLDLLKKNEGDIAAVIDKYPEALKMITHLEKYCAYKFKPKNFVKKIIVYWGRPGAGKSKKANRYFEKLGIKEDEVYNADYENNFWLGYNQEKYVILDDFDGSTMKYKQFLRFIDRYKRRCNVKGTSKNWCAETIIITSNTAPITWWKGLNSNELKALQRRLPNITYFGKTTREVGFTYVR